MSTEDIPVSDCAQRVETSVEEMPEDSVEDTAEDTSEEMPATPSVKDIPRRRIADLSNDEREILIAAAKRGEFNDHYKVKLFKNGNSRIVKNGSSLDYTPTVEPHRMPHAAASPTSTTPQQNSSTLSNDQFLMQHIIGLEARFTKMAMKHKRLKNKYLELESSIYADDGYTESAPMAYYDNVEDPVPQPREIREESPGALSTKCEPPLRTPPPIREEPPLPQPTRYSASNARIAGNTRGRGWRATLMSK